MPILSKTLCLIALTATCATGLIAAEETPAATGNQTAERGERGQRSPEEWAARREQREWERLTEAKPELAGVDPKSAEGQAALAAYRDQRMQERGEEMRGRIAEQQSSRHEELRVALGFEPEVFEAVQPLLQRVETLQMQRSLTNLGASPMMRMMPQRGGRGRGPDPSRMASMLLGDTELDPTVASCQEAATALNTLVDDPQSSDDEIAQAVKRLRDATAAFAQTLDSAQDELRSVLSPRQEAYLLNQGILD